ncbi:hypothetical protein CAPTEDRAFT_195638 [Capitella teleta]|uniref:EGF-like domain-containing protein n=1 Tax=Capitella teleta TaxID=283909 RepID=X1ZVB3_CAPTE|nr:hypothetical protein CAPTEDRAFT_195638 [Capitella teleta]|eukprot:ELT88353.1 hypothetical protein CAPTEDRAFT_195638 [Capitella teleta]
MVRFAGVVLLRACVALFFVDWGNCASLASAQACALDNNPCKGSDPGGCDFKFPHKNRTKYVQCKPSGACSELTCENGSVWDEELCGCYPDMCLKQQPCKHSGSCFTFGEAFICTCSHGWTGETCEEKLAMKTNFFIVVFGVGYRLHFSGLRITRSRSPKVMKSQLPSNKSDKMRTPVVSITPTSESRGLTHGNTRGRECTWKQGSARLSTHKLPIVKLKECGEISRSASAKRGRSVAEFNNLRSKYENYCHYRRPNSTTQPASGSKAESKATDKDQCRFPRSRSMTPVLSGGNNQMTSTQKPLVHPAKRASNSIRDYEVRGTTLNHKVHSARPDLLLKAFLEENVVAGGHLDKSARDENRLYMDAGAMVGYCSAQRDQVPDDTPTKPVYDHRSFRSILDDTNKSLHRRVKFKGEESGLVTSYALTAETDDSLRIGLTENPASLTEHNLQIFNRFNHTTMPRSTTSVENAASARAPISERVLEWVMERCHVSDSPKCEVISPSQAKADSFLPAATCT